MRRRSIFLSSHRVSKESRLCRIARSLCVVQHYQTGVAPDYNSSRTEFIMFNHCTICLGCTALSTCCGVLVRPSTMTCFEGGGNTRLLYCCTILRVCKVVTIAESTGVALCLYDIQTQHLSKEEGSHKKLSTQHLSPSTQQTTVQQHTATTHTATTYTAAASLLWACFSEILRVSLSCLVLVLLYVAAVAARFFLDVQQ